MCAVTGLGWKATLQAVIPVLRSVRLPGRAVSLHDDESRMKGNRGCLGAQKRGILQETRRSLEVFLEDTDPWCKSWKMRRQCGVGSISDAGQEGGAQSEMHAIERGRFHSVSVGIAWGEARGVSRVQASWEDLGYHRRMLTGSHGWICFLREVT